MAELQEQQEYEQQFSAPLKPTELILALAELVELAKISNESKYYCSACDFVGKVTAGVETESGNTYYSCNQCWASIEEDTFNNEATLKVFKNKIRELALKILKPEFDQCGLPEKPPERLINESFEYLFGQILYYIYSAKSPFVLAICLKMGVDLLKEDCK